jgi:hypothetical protein
VIAGHPLCLLGARKPLGRREVNTIPLKPPLVERCLRLVRSRPVRLTVNGLSLAVVAVVVFFAVRHFQRHGWPLRHANVLLVLAASGLFLAAYGFKAFGWRRLFARSERPSSLTLAAAGGAAAVTGIALPGRFDEAVRIGVVRRLRANAQASVRSAFPCSCSA